MIEVKKMSAQEFIFYCNFYFWKLFKRNV